MPTTREPTVDRNTKAGVRATTAIVTDARVGPSPPNQETVAAHTRFAVAADQRNDTTATAAAARPGPRGRPGCPWR
jgi:hypothetical protein